MEEYASWTSYGAKIGNYSDDSHDFSKVNSVNYKFAGEIEQTQSKKPLFALFAKDGHNLKMSCLSKMFIMTVFRHQGSKS